MRLVARAERYVRCFARLVGLAALTGGVGLCGEVLQQGEECRRLTDEKPVGGERFHGSHGGAIGFRGSNDRDGRESFVQENGRLRHDQVGLEILGMEARRAHQIEDNFHARHRIGVRGIGAITSLVAPGLEMHDFRSADAEQDSQHLGVSDSLSQGWVQARTALLDRAEVKARRVGDSLQMAGATEISVGAGYGGVLSDGQRGNRLRKTVAEVWILRTAAVTRPPTGVHRELREVREPAKLVGARRFAAGQSAELVEAHGVSALGSEIRVDEGLVGKFVFGIVMNVLRHV